MPTCNNCDEFVSVEFTRVLGNNEDEVDGCLHCQAAGGLTTG